MAAAQQLSEPIEPRQRDAELMKRVAGGSQAAFASLHEAHHRAVFRLALATVLDREEARDVSQEVFVRLHRVAASWQPRATVRTWLHRTTLNVALSTRRQLTRWLRPRGSSQAFGGDAEQLAAARKTLDHARDALALLSPRQRAVTSLHLDAELSPTEIAEHLGISANAARVTLHKGLTRLRAALKKEES